LCSDQNSERPSQMPQDQVEFKPFGIESRARPYRLAFLVDPEACSPELLDSLFEANYELWGGRFNPIVPVSNGEIDEAFWSLLRYVDPDLVYTYTSLSQNTIDRIEREIVPWRIEAHPSHLVGPDPPYHFRPDVSEGLVGSRQVLPLLMSQQVGFAFGNTPTLLTYFHDWKSPLNKDLARLVTRNFGIIQERAFPKVPDDWTRLQVQNNWSPCELFNSIATTPNLVFPFQSAVTHATSPPRINNVEEKYCIVVGDNAETWIYFWNRIFLINDYVRSGWNSLCLSPALLREDSFVGPLREFLKRHVHRSGNSPSTLTLQSFECSEDDLTELKIRLLNGLDIIPRSRKLNSREFPKLQVARSPFHLGWGSATTHQQGTSRESLLSAPQSRVPIDEGTWVMDLRIQYIPRFGFYANEVLSWKLPRRIGIAEAFFRQRRCRIGADYSLSVEMRHLEPFILRLPDENEIFHRAVGVMEIDTYDSNLKIIRKKPQFCRLGKWDKGLYLNGILELFGGLQSASRVFEHSYWRCIFERLSMLSAEKEAGLFERVRNGLEKKKTLLTRQLTGGHDKPLDWLSHFVIRHARELQLRHEEISFSELESSFQKQRERFIAENPGFRSATSTEEVEMDRKAAKGDLLGVVQSLTDSGVFLQGIRVRCTNCGSRFWREMGALQQKVRCDGCSATVAVPVESIWCYRLNSLIRNGIALHGCVPVISALRHLRESAKDSFIYTHGIGLFKDYGDRQPATEMDLLCISDGNLVCGEVKSSASEFTREELEKLARIAADIRADQAAISAFHDPDRLMPKHAKVLADLVPPGCSVIICGPSQWAFQPQPHAL
jgi:hypothetical protein